MSAAPSHLLEVNDLSVVFHTSERNVVAVDRVSFFVDDGETLAVLGESGSGKSVSAAAIMNIIDAPPGEVTSGRIEFHGRDLMSLSADERRRINGSEIAIVFQDPLAYLNPVYSVGWQIAEVFRVHQGIPARDAMDRAVGLLERVEIADAKSRARQYPHQFSGGQRQRIMIAMALALHPKLLIADEPTSALDVTVQVQILRLLRELQAEEGMSLILITHDLTVAAHMADRVAVMNAGRIVETGTTVSVFTNPQHPYTRRLIQSVPGRGGLHGAGHAPGEPLVQVSGLVKDFPARSGVFRKGDVAFRAVDDVSLSIDVGETVGVVGESGAGKSTVARMLVRLEEPTAGTALYRGRDVFRMTGGELRRYRQRVQMVFQDPFGSLDPRMTIGEVIAEPWAIHPEIAPKSEWTDRAVELLRLVDLSPDHIRRYPHQFSGGQCQRIAIARALASEPELVICDEAVSALDVSVQAQVLELLAQLRERLGLAYLFITHDLPVVRDFASRIVVMKSGRVVEEGSCAKIFGDPEHPYTRTLLGTILPPKPPLEHLSYRRV